MLATPVDIGRDHVLGAPDAEMTLVEYGSYACQQCHAVHSVIEGLRSRFGERMRYVFRQMPAPRNEVAIRAAEFAEIASQTTGRFWEIHEALMERGPALSERHITEITRDFQLPFSSEIDPKGVAAAQEKIREDIRTAQQSGALVTPTFFINGRR